MVCGGLVGRGAWLSVGCDGLVGRVVCLSVGCDGLVGRGAWLYVVCGGLVGRGLWLSVWCDGLVGRSLWVSVGCDGLVGRGLWLSVVNGEWMVRTLGNSVGVAFSKPRVEACCASTLGARAHYICYSVRVAFRRRRYTQLDYSPTYR